MRTSLKLSISALALTTGIMACAEAPAAEANKTDLQRDLELASATTVNLAAPRVDSTLLNAMETQPQGKPEAAKTLRRSAGLRAVRSQAPTVRATPVVEVAEVEESEEVQTESVAPVAEETTEPVAVAPRPAPAGDYGTGGGILGGGVLGDGGGSGGGGGSVIRGGGVHGDNCELHRRPRNGGIYGRPVYYPRPTANIPVSGPSARDRIESARGGRTTSSQPTVSGRSGIGSRIRGRG